MKKKETLIIQNQGRHAPGNVELLIPKSSFEFLREVESSRKERLYLGRAHLSSVSDNTRHHTKALFPRGSTLFRLSRNNLRMWVEEGASGVVFTLKRNRYGMLDRVEAYAKGRLPSNALNVFKTALFTLLDKLVTDAKCPIYVEGIALLLGRRILVHELPITYAGERVISDPFGYGNVHWFAPLASLEREALCSDSPFYKLLCRFRAYEGVKGYLRTELRAFAKEIGVNAELPKTPRITEAERQAMRLTEPALRRARTYEGLAEVCRTFRNGIAHFLIDKPFEGMVLPSRGVDRSEAELLSQLLRICNEKLTTPLWEYFNKWLSNEYDRGRILVDYKRPKDFPAGAEGED